MVSADEFTRNIALRWKSRREAQGYKPKSTRHTDAQFEFFTGAFAAAEAIGQPYNRALMIFLSMGDDLPKLILKESAPKKAGQL